MYILLTFGLGDEDTDQLAHTLTKWQRPMAAMIHQNAGNVIVNRLSTDCSVPPRTRIPGALTAGVWADPTQPSKGVDMKTQFNQTDHGNGR